MRAENPDSPGSARSSSDVATVDARDSAPGIGDRFARNATPGSILLAASWFAVALAGQVAALQLMRAGRGIGWQHYAPTSDWLATSVLPWLVVLGAQALLVAIRGRDLWLDLWRWVGERAGTTKVALAMFLFVATSAVVERSPLEFGAHLGLATFVQLVGLANIVLAAARLDDAMASAFGARVETWLAGAPTRAGRAVDVFPAMAAVWVIIVSAALGLLAYQQHPHVPDEVVYLLHARYFAEGMLAMPAAPVPAAFELDLMAYEPSRWYSPVPPAWPAVLAIGVRLGVPWLINPLLAGVSLLLVHSLVLQWYDRRAARLSVLLLCASPWFLFMSMNLMTHTLTLAAALAGAAAVSRLVRGGPLGWAVSAGICIGILALLRPLEALIAAGLLGGWVLIAGRGSARPARTAVTAFAVMTFSAIATSALVLPYNAALSGDAMTFPIMAYTDRVYGTGSNALGFGANRGLPWPGLDPLPGHGAIDVVLNTALNTYQVNVELLGWSAGSLLPILLLPLLGKLRRADLLLLVAIGAVVGAHAFYWFSGGPDFGARYWYLILVPCAVLAARGVLEAADAAEARSAHSAGSARSVARHRAARVVLGALAFSACALLVFVPWRAVDKYRGYRGMRPDIRRLAAQHDFGESLVLVRGRRFPDYASAAAYNPVDLRAPAPIYVWDRSPEVRRAVLEAYRGRRVWIVAGPSETGDGFNLERGPVPAAELLREEEAAR